MDLGTRIAQWRRARGLTQRDLANAVGVSVSAVSYWESNTHPPSQKHLDAIVRALGLTMERFYGRIPTVKVKAA